MALCAPRKPEDFRGLSLCSGVGGLDLGLHIAEPGYRTVCYVERNSFAASALVARMADASLDPAPIWDDLKSFDGRPWRGRVHILTAGYPCQPFSMSGLRKGEADPRHLWPDVARVIDEVRPEWCFFENVPGHLTLGLRDVVGDLQRLGYRVAARVQSAAEVGASHRRDRLFILAHADCRKRGESGKHSCRTGWPEVPSRPQSGRETNRAEERSYILDAALGYTDSQRLDTGAVPLFAPGPGEFELWGETLNRWPGLKPGVYRPVDGLAFGLDRSAAAGNGVVPLAAARAFIALREELTEWT
ncbi:MAG: DNA cytosine methyltransferase [Rhodobacteraceae bacterium]|nr:DNA cytosine methyltransferase [Paracoccaceae bacterium]